MASVSASRVLNGLVFVLSFCCCSSIDCDLYMAESTIPNAGLGIFSTIELHPGDAVGEGDVCIPIFDLNSHHSDPFNPFGDYVWAGEVMGMKLEVSSEDIEALCPGLDCAINCNLALINVAKATPIFDDGGLHRAAHPGAGAITPYHNGTTRVTRTVPVGGELFKFYGDAWFTTRKVFDSLPISGDYPKAQRLLETFFNTVAGKEKHNAATRIGYEDVIIPIRSIWDSRTLNALPKTYEEALVAREHDIGMTHQPNATRTVAWLAENGKCVDHISPGQSTIEGAGHGAFAKRDLPKGTVITGSPMHHLPMKDSFMPMHRVFGNDDNTDSRSEDDIIGYQLLMNYCFGHPETSLLLCPYGAGVSYINHNKTQANVRVVWSRDGVTAHHDSWFLKEPRDMLSTKGARLALDYVATRGIAEGEELFLDYGDEWEDAWQDHSAKWENWEENFLGARAWNELFSAHPMRTAEEAFYDPYPPYIQIRCHTDIAEDDWGSIAEWGLSDYGYECEIVDRFLDSQGNEFYNVRVRTEAIDRWDYEFDVPEILEIAGIPRTAIRFFDGPFTSDLHMRGVFRHVIGLPDELMHSAWRSKSSKSETVRTTPKDEL